MGRERLKPLFDRPQGALILKESAFGHFVTEHVYDAVKCEMCGTRHPALDENEIAPYQIAKILSRNMVLHCCGKMLFDLYKERGEQFFLMKLDDIARDPAPLARLILHACTQIKTGKEKLEAAVGDINEAASSAGI